MQIEKLSNELLDSCDQFRESMGEVTDNVSLATALETLWSERVESSSSSTASTKLTPVHLCTLADTLKWKLHGVMQAFEPTSSASRRAM